MDHSSEISNVTVIHADLNHLEIGEEDEEEIELADEADEDIDMRGEDRTTGKQTSSNQISAPDLQQKAKLAPVIVHVKPGEWSTKFVDNASDAEPKKMEAPNKDLDKEVEKELEQVDLSVSKLQDEVEPPVATEPHTALQTQNKAQNNAEIAREHKDQPCLSVVVHQSQVTMAGPVEKQVEGKSEIRCKGTKTRVSLKMEDKPKEHSEEGQCAEKIAEQEVVAYSKVRIKDSQCQEKRKTPNSMFNNDAAMENINLSLNMADVQIDLSSATCYSKLEESGFGDAGKQHSFPAIDKIEEFKKLLVEEQQGVSHFYSERGIKGHRFIQIQSEGQVPVSLNLEKETKKAMEPVVTDQHLKDALCEVRKEPVTSEMTEVCQVSH